MKYLLIFIYFFNLSIHFWAICVEIANLKCGIGKVPPGVLHPILPGAPVNFRIRGMIQLTTLYPPFKRNTIDPFKFQQAQF